MEQINILSYTLLGKGHYGKVYRALLNNKEKRAIKIIPKIKFEKKKKKYIIILFIIFSNSN